MISSDPVYQHQRSISSEQGLQNSPNSTDTMLSEIFNFFTGTNGSPKSVSYLDHIIPGPPVREAQTLSYAECEGWVGKRVVIPLIKFRYPQLGTVRYIGCDSTGILCAGIEFDRNIGGMSGKQSGVRIFECKQKHGLLIPVEYVSFLNSYVDCANLQIPPDSDSAYELHRTRSVPALSRSISVRDFEAENVPGLRIGDTVVWLGGIRPMTGVVKWVGRDGRSRSIPLKAWVEMDEQVDYGYDEFDLGFKFGCAKGRGRLLPVDELILLANYLPVENTATPNGGSSPIETGCPISMDLIDFGQTESKRRKGTHEPNNVDVENSEIIQHFDDSPFKRRSCEPGLSSPRERVIPIVLESGETVQKKAPHSPLPTSKIINGEPTESLVVPDLNPAPPFIISPIKINDFFQAEGLRGIQGRRNSCYIDVVLFAMFAFSETFDTYFLELEDPASSVDETELKRVCRKVLRENIVNPLRQNFFCPAESITILRDLLKPLSDKVDGAFMDVEEFMLILFNKVFKMDEFIVYDTGVKDYLHQINLGDHSLPNVITVKRCLELSMADYRLKMEKLPAPALILEIPRNNESVIQSTTIVPNLSLDISDLCKNDYKGPTKLNLLAVICIKDYHYVTFVKSGSGALSHWVLFDSNPSEEKPKVEIVPQMGECLESLEYYCKSNPDYFTANRHKLHPMVQRLLADMYVCIYCPE